jgi:sugar transferase EpsL
VKRRRPIRHAIKRAIDVIVAVAAVVALLPVLAVTAVAVVLVDGRPILFRQPRPGLGGAPFTIIKFRTMRRPRPGEVAHQTDDERVTRLGRLLRSTSIDELPELWNVLRGEMSLVGPRPLLMEYLATYTESQRRRQDVRPGITSWAAVNGRHMLKFQDRLALDTWYVDHWSLRLDARILLMTIAQVIRHTDVTTTQGVADIGFPLPWATAPGEADDATRGREPGP